MPKDPLADLLQGAIEEAIDDLVGGEYDDGVHPIVAGVIANLQATLREAEDYHQFSG